jgi:hypothetical protein
MPSIDSGSVIAQLRAAGVDVGRISPTVDTSRILLTMALNDLASRGTQLDVVRRYWLANSTARVGENGVIQIRCNQRGARVLVKNGQTAISYHVVVQATGDATVLTTEDFADSTVNNATPGGLVVDSVATCGSVATASLPTLARIPQIDNLDVTARVGTWPPGHVFEVLPQQTISFMSPAANQTCELHMIWEEIGP